VGTPSARNGDLSVEQLECALGEIRQHLAGRSGPLILAIRRTQLGALAGSKTAPGRRMRLAGTKDGG
jgi:hypothetical protein